MSQRPTIVKCKSSLLVVMAITAIMSNTGTSHAASSLRIACRQAVCDLQVSDVPRRQVLAILAAELRAELVGFEDDAGPLTLTAKAVSAEEAIRRILPGVSFVVIYDGRSGLPSRLLRLSSPGVESGEPSLLDETARIGADDEPLMLQFPSHEDLTPPSRDERRVHARRSHLVRRFVRQSSPQARAETIRRLERDGPIPASLAMHLLDRERDPDLRRVLIALAASQLDQDATTRDALTLLVAHGSGPLAAAATEIIEQMTPEMVR